MKKIAVLGSTGSIGTQALDVIRKNPHKFKAVVLSAAENIDLLSEQIVEFEPEAVVVAEEKHIFEIKKKHPHVEVLHGTDGLIAAASEIESDMVLNSLVGMTGLCPTYHAVKAGRDVALANKETLVSGGSIIMNAASEKKARVLPVDSEHSAVFQCLEGNDKDRVRRIILTASGGPFRGYSIEKLSKASVEDALNHPNWRMGKKVTVDSATLMNKGLEVIEARWLFDMPAEKIDVVVHPQSIIHSMVEYEDHSIIAQLGVPDMRIPISHALSYPERLPNDMEGVDFCKLGMLTFEEPDRRVFRCLDLAFEAIRKGGSYPIVLNAANEMLVQLFLEKKIKLTDIQDNISDIMEEHIPVFNLDLDSVLAIDKEIRERVLEKWR